MNSLEYIKKTLELISLGDNINIKARLIHLKRHIEEDYEKHEKNMEAFAEWIVNKGWVLQKNLWYRFLVEEEGITTSQLREKWENEGEK